MPKVTFAALRSRSRQARRVQACELAGKEIALLLSRAADDRWQLQECLSRSLRAAQAAGKLRIARADGRRSARQRDGQKAREGVMGVLLINHPARLPDRDRRRVRPAGPGMAYAAGSRVPENKRAIRRQIYGPVIKTR